MAPTQNINFPIELQENNFRELFIRQQDTNHQRVVVGCGVRGDGQPGPWRSSSSSPPPPQELQRRHSCNESILSSRSSRSRGSSKGAGWNAQLLPPRPGSPPIHSTDKSSEKKRARRDPTADTVCPPPQCPSCGRRDRVSSGWGSGNSCMRRLHHQRDVPPRDVREEAKRHSRRRSLLRV